MTDAKFLSTPSEMMEEFFTKHCRSLHLIWLMRKCDYANSFFCCCKDARGQIGSQTGWPKLENRRDPDTPLFLSRICSLQIKIFYLGIEIILHDQKGPLLTLVERHIV